MRGHTYLQRTTSTTYNTITPIRCVQIVNYGELFISKLMTTAILIQMGIIFHEHSTI